MKLHGAVGGLLFSVLAGSLAMAGCSSSTTGGTGGTSGTGSEPPVTGCTQDSTLSCDGGGFGYACDAGDNPENYDSLVCSDPTANGSEDDFCCVVDSTPVSGCTPDDNITAACAEGYGFSCAAGDNPDTGDGSLVCSDPTPDGSNDDFCCNYTGSTSSSGGSSGGVVPTGCTADSTVDCSGSGADGYSCGAGDNPENYDNLVSSDPTPNGSDDDFCCFDGGTDFSSTTCEPDDTISGFCDPGSYGFQCASGDDPSTYDATLNCSTNQPDPDGVHDDYCCTY